MFSEAHVIHIVDGLVHHLQCFLVVSLFFIFYLASSPQCNVYNGEKHELSVHGTTFHLYDTTCSVYFLKCCKLFLTLRKVILNTEPLM